jgi:hypothetical protein
LDAEDALAGVVGSKRPFMLEPGMKWVDTQWSPRELEWLNARKLNRLEVAAAYHIPAKMLLASDDGDDPDSETLKVFYTSSLPPRLSRVEAEIEAQLLPEFDLLSSVRRRHYVEFNLDAKLRGSFEEQAAIMATTAGGPIITVNEARARLNLPAVEGGDLIFVPLNSVRAGGPQGSPQAPVATPAEGVEPAGTTPGEGTDVSDRVQRASVEDVLAGNFLAIDNKNVGDSTDIKRMVKAADDKRAYIQFLKTTRQRYENQARELYAKHVARVKNVLDAGNELKRDRWDRELADDLFAFTYQVVDVFGSDAAKRIGGTWDAERTVNYLRINAMETAKMLNDSIEKAHANGNDPGDDVYLDSVAQTRATWSMNWAVMEAAHQNEED